MNKTIYLDHAAATPMDDMVLQAMQPYFSDKFYNPSASYLAAKSVRSDVQVARAEGASALGVKPNEIIFTAGGTEANNLALFGVLQAHPGAHVVTTALEHESVRMPLEWLSTKGHKFTEVLPQATGVVDPAAVAEAVNDKTVLVSVMYANNEIGTVQPIKQIAGRLASIRAERVHGGNNLPLYFHTDACQAANYLDLHARRLGVDLMTLNGGKIYGPKQSGALFAASHVQLVPQILGGGQEHGRRSGTENVAAVIGFARALLLAQSHRPGETARLKSLQKQFIQLLKDKIPSAQINGSLAMRLPNNVHITIPGSDNERLLFGLDGHGIQAAAGSACSASSQESSHVLRSIGLSDASARSSLRFSLGRATDYDQIEKVVTVLSKLVA